MNAADALDALYIALARAAGRYPVQLDGGGWRAECPVSHDACLLFDAGSSREPVRMLCRAKRPACTLSLVCHALGLSVVDERRVTGMPRPEPLRRAPWGDQ